MMSTSVDSYFYKDSLYDSKRVKELAETLVKVFEQKESGFAQVEFHDALIALVMLHGSRKFQEKQLDAYSLYNFLHKRLGLSAQ